MNKGVEFVSDNKMEIFFKQRSIEKVKLTLFFASIYFQHSVKNIIDFGYDYVSHGVICDNFSLRVKLVNPPSVKTRPHLDQTELLYAQKIYY